MYDVDQLLEMAKDILRRRYRRLSESVINVLAGQAIAKTIDTSLTQTQVKRELGKRITGLVNSQFPQRVREDHQSEIDPEHSTDIADARLSKYALDSTASPQSVSAQRERESAQDLVEEALQQASPANETALEKIRDVIEPGDSIRELARKSGLFPTQVSRALSEARDVLEGKKPRRPVVPSASSDRFRTEGLEFNPPTVAEDDRMRIHDGAMMAAWTDLRSTASSNGHSTQARPKDISNLPRPRWPVFVEHPLFGRGAILRDRSDLVDIEFDKAGTDGRRRRTIQREFLKFSNGTV